MHLSNVLCPFVCNLYLCLSVMFSLFLFSFLPACLSLYVRPCICGYSLFSLSMSCCLHNFICLCVSFYVTLSFSLFPYTSYSPSHQPRLFVIESTRPFQDLHYEKCNTRHTQNLKDEKTSKEKQKQTKQNLIVKALSKSEQKKRTISPKIIIIMPNQ